MNIAAIYDKYDLWGKVRVSNVIRSNQGIPLNIPNWLIVIDGVKYYWPMTQGLVGVMKAALKDYIKCEHCEGTGEVPAPHYTKGGEAPDCDFVKCKYCNGTGEK